MMSIREAFAPQIHTVEDHEDGNMVVYLTPQDDGVEIKLVEIDDLHHLEDHYELADPPFYQDSVIPVLKPKANAHAG